MEKNNKTTKQLVSQLTLVANNTRESPVLKKILLQASDRLNLLHEALGEIVEDSQLGHHANNCGDPYCPINHAVQVYSIGERNG